MTKLAIVGCGDLGLQIAHHARQSGIFTIAGFFDDFATSGTLIGEYRILGQISTIEEVFQNETFDQILIGIGYKHIDFRQQLYERLRTKVPFATLIHPRTTIDATCSIGQGTVIYPGCILDMHTAVGENVLMNIDCAISHDSRIGAGCFLSPAVKIAGFVSIGSRTTLGIGTTVIDNVEIGSNIRTGAGAVVVNDLVEPGLYMGVPAKLRIE